MLNLTERGVEVFRSRFNNEKQLSFWDNFDLIIWKKDYNGYNNIKGMFVDSWGVAETVSVNDNGIWKLPKKYVRYFK